MNGPGGVVFQDPLFSLRDSFDFVQESHAPLNPSAKLTEQSLSKAMIHTMADLEFIRDACVLQSICQDAGIDEVTGMVVIPVQDIGRRE